MSGFFIRSQKRNSSWQLASCTTSGRLFSTVPACLVMWWSSIRGGFARSCLDGSWLPRCSCKRTHSGNGSSSKLSQRSVRSATWRLCDWEFSLKSASRLRSCCFGISVWHLQPLEPDPNRATSSQRFSVLRYEFSTRFPPTENRAKGFMRCPDQSLLSGQPETRFSETPSTADVLRVVLACESDLDMIGPAAFPNFQVKMLSTFEDVRVWHGGCEVSTKAGSFQLLLQASSSRLEMKVFLEAGVSKEECRNFFQDDLTKVMMLLRQVFAQLCPGTRYLVRMGLQEDAATTSEPSAGSTEPPARLRLLSASELVRQPQHQLLLSQMVHHDDSLLEEFLGAVFGREQLELERSQAMSQSELRN
eukprot:m.546279 g.546279  ORF g.546279 m.546279 type:complete len:361 (+) comp57685_c0_seq12:699-1781(+)